MSNNLVTEQLSLSNQQMTPLEANANNLDSSIPSVQMGQIGTLPNNNGLQHLSVSSKQMELLESISCAHVPPMIPVSSNQLGQIEAKAGTLVAQQYLMPNRPLEVVDSNVSNFGLHQSSVPSKRKAPVEPISYIPGPQQISMPNKRAAQMEHRPWLQQLFVPNKKIPGQTAPNTPGSQHLPPPNKKIMRTEATPRKAAPLQVATPKGQTTQMQPSPKVRPESFESVRSKLRESLAEALALVSQQQDKPPHLEKDPKNEVANTSIERQSQEDSKPVESASDVNTVGQVSEKPSETLLPKEEFSSQKCADGQTATQITNENSGDFAQTWKYEKQDFQLNTELPDAESSFSDNFFVKDELLQGNGLSWALDLDMEVPVSTDIPTPKSENLEGKEVVNEAQKAAQSPQVLAFEIEAELFKLFGGVNKKYKEKGRSLLFNLKDRNNPELRESVVAGKISPKRLCSMTAEELASKELSEWRIAKAEELAQMVVLPNSEVDIRRLVRKTHKGEFQVEVEQDDGGASVEVSVGASSLTQVRKRIKEKEARRPSEHDGTKRKSNLLEEKSSIGQQDPPCSLTILPNEGTDLMQGLMGDEFKDESFLPPIVSLDEFMESLDSEPPFEILPVDPEKVTPTSDKDNSEVNGSPKVTNSALNKPDKMQEKDAKSDANEKPNEDHVKSETTLPVDTSKGSEKSSHTHGQLENILVDQTKSDHVWEGILQLNVSSMATVVGFFKSGEKATTKEWPSLLEIKGRVRLDAFEKFLQELPMSRSRATMVVHFAWKEGSPENGRANLCEVAESYVLDERVGFAEPVPGTELYFCPPHTRTLETISKHLFKDQTETLLNSTTDNGLIGVVVWRKAHLISPNSSSLHKHGSKKQPHFSTRRHQEKDANMNANFFSRTPHPVGSTPNRPGDDDDDDDVPPGFGPGAASRDEDDLPEFQFSGSGSHPSSSTVLSSQTSTPRGPGVAAPFNHHPPQNPSRPVEQMRQLVQKYGQPAAQPSPGSWREKSRLIGHGTQPWADDDDDDIPEWQPQPPPQQHLLQPQHPAPPAAYGFPTQMQQQHPGAPQPLLPPLPANLVQPQHHLPTLPWQQQQQQQGAWWVPPSGPQGQGNAFYPGVGAGMNWRQDVPRSRGF